MNEVPIDFYIKIKTLKNKTQYINNVKFLNLQYGS